jgi:ABC-type spermidine/putrescine transport system permease subunit II
MAVFIVALVGIPAAFGLARSSMSTRWKGVWLLLSFAPLIVPIIVIAVATFVWFLELRFVGSTLALAAAHATLGLPFVVVIVAAGLRDFDERLEVAARSLGAKPRAVYRRITLPLILPAVLSGLFFAFLISFDEFLIARGVTRVGSETLPLRLWNGIRDEISPALAVVSVISIVITILLFLSAFLLLRRRSARRLRRAT